MMACTNNVSYFNIQACARKANVWVKTAKSVMKYTSWFSFPGFSLDAINGDRRLWMTDIQSPTNSGRNVESCGTRDWSAIMKRAVLVAHSITAGRRAKNVVHKGIAHGTLTKKCQTVSVQYCLQVTGWLVSVGEAKMSGLAHDAYTQSAVGCKCLTYEQ